MLAEWLIKDDYPIFILQAIGGMGKSSLSWYWLQNDIGHIPLDGIIWWSFYEGEPSFSKFLNEAIIYISDRTIDLSRFPTNYDKIRALVNLLQQRQILFILDGFERQLRVYTGLNSAYQLDEIVSEPTDARSCVDPNVARFLRDLAANTTKAKVLITTRLMIQDLEDNGGVPLAGCFKQELKSLHSNDAVNFMRSQGVTKGTKTEITTVCNMYGYHPLSLRLLSGMITRDKRFPGDIVAAPRYDIQASLVARQHHVLEVAYNALPNQLQVLLSRIAAFRTSIFYDSLAIFNEFKDDLKFDASIDELIERGLIFFNVEQSRFDLHPVVRAYAYDRLINRKEVHKLLYNYFLTVPIPEKLNTMDDLIPIIELLFHSVGAELYEDAFKSYRLNQMNYALRYWGKHELALSLLAPLIKAWETKRWNATVYQRSWLLNERGVQLMFLGKLMQAEETFQTATKWYELDRNVELQSNGWMNISYVRSEMGNFQDALNAVAISKKFASEIGMDDMLRYDISPGRYHVMLGEFDVGLIKLENGIVRSRREKANRAECTGLLSRGEYYLREGKIYKAVSDFNRVLELARLDKQRDYEGRALIGLADCYRETGQIDKSHNLLNQAEYVAYQTGFQDVEVLLWISFAKLAEMQGNMTAARDFALRTLEIAERSPYRVQATEAFLVLARLEAKQDKMRSRKFKEYLQRAMELVNITKHYWTSDELSCLIK